VVGPTLETAYKILSEGRVIRSFLEKKLTRFVPLTIWSLMSSHASGTEGWKILKQWYRRDDNFSRGKSMIFITFRGTKGILSRRLLPEFRKKFKEN
jgi:hypothetical protein